jgi:hypothetical protein
MTTQRLIHSTSRPSERPTTAASEEPESAAAQTPMTAGGLEAARSELARLRRSSRLDVEHRLPEP